MNNSIELSPTEIEEMFGGEAQPIQTNPDEIEVSLALRHIRDCLIEVAQQEGVGTNQLAARLGISPSSVSRMLNGEGDVRASTIVLYARALGRAWNMNLVPHGCAQTSRANIVPEAHLVSPHTESSSRRVDQIFYYNQNPAALTARVAA